MVPCADMANHVLSPNAAYQFVPEDDAFQLAALQARGGPARCRPGEGGCPSCCVQAPLRWAGALSYEVSVRSHEGPARSPAVRAGGRAAPTWRAPLPAQRMRPRPPAPPAPQDIPAGAEACISYGCTHKDNEGMMRDYGFVIPGNVNDRVPFSAGGRAPL